MTANKAHYQILVVDDMSEIRDLLTRMLEGMGHKVQSASSGEQALDLLDEFPAEVIISDISMPQMNGYELVRVLRLRPDTRYRYIIAMSGNTESSSRHDSLAAGFDAYISKPFEMTTIHRVLTGQQRTVQQLSSFQSSTAGISMDEHRD